MSKTRVRRVATYTMPYSTEKAKAPPPLLISTTTALAHKPLTVIRLGHMTTSEWHFHLKFLLVVSIHRNQSSIHGTKPSRLLNVPVKSESFQTSGETSTTVTACASIASAWEVQPVGDWQTAEHQ